MVVRVRVRVYPPTNLSKYCFLISAPTSHAHSVGVYVSTFEALAMACWWFLKMERAYAVVCNVIINSPCQLLPGPICNVKLQCAETFQ